MVAYLSSSINLPDYIITIVAERLHKSGYITVTSMEEDPWQPSFKSLNRAEIRTSDLFIGFQNVYEGDTSLQVHDEWKYAKEMSITCIYIVEKEVLSFDPIFSKIKKTDDVYIVDKITSQEVISIVFGNITKDTKTLIVDQLPPFMRGIIRRLLGLSNIPQSA